MTNAEKYRTPEERSKAFDEYKERVATIAEYKYHETIFNRKFEWLEFEAGQESNAKEEKNIVVEKQITTNEEKYKTSKEREIAFKKFCENYNTCSDGCPCLKNFCVKVHCKFAWLSMEAK